MSEPTPPNRTDSNARGQRLALVLLGILAPLILLVWLTLTVLSATAHGQAPAWDQTILDWYRQRRTPTLNSLALNLSLLGNLAFLPLTTVLIMLALWVRRWKMQAWFLGLSFSGSLALNLAAKAIVQRPRPSPLQAVAPDPGFSFPSGHAMTNAAFGIALVYIFWRTPYRWYAALLGLGWASVIGVCRNYLGVHFPSDVLAGQLSSLIWVTLLYLLFTRRSHGWPAAEPTPAGSPATAPAER